MKKVSRTLARFICGQRCAVFCLAYLGLLTFFGTLYQAEEGLYRAQEVFYRSWWILVGGGIPLPGAQTILLLLGVNLVCAMGVWAKFRIFLPGLLLLHTGLLVLLVSGAITRFTAKESFLTLLEGETSNVTSDYRDWEIAMWIESDYPREITAIELQDLQSGGEAEIPHFKMRLDPHVIYEHSIARTGSEAMEGLEIRNASGIRELVGQTPLKDPLKHTPGVVLRVVPDTGEPVSMILFGRERFATPIDLEVGRVYFQLRRIRTPMPFSVTLEDFKKEIYQGTVIPRSFESTVNLREEVGERKAVISMNQPLRLHGFTLYQSSYQQFRDGLEASTFSVVENPARQAPYWGTAITTLGLVLHFLIELFRHARKRRTP